ncbi:hypothetical protein LCGC14_1863600 [marine sediment metagenome]|uniref:Uncharacterized protein n=1 Tax=marine sediment metagenome TaxID=412755 RepID=A0A0F9G736_9ZZZZ
MHFRLYRIKRRILDHFRAGRLRRERDRFEDQLGDAGDQIGSITEDLRGQRERLQRLVDESDGRQRNLDKLKKASANLASVMLRRQGRVEFDETPGKSPRIKVSFVPYTNHSVDLVAAVATEFPPANWAWHGHRLSRGFDYYSPSTIEEAVLQAEGLLDAKLREVVEVERMAKALDSMKEKGEAETP